MKLFQQRKAPKWILGLALLGVSCAMNAQEQEKVQGFVHEQSDENGYVWPTDSLVLKKLDVWKDQKFGVLFRIIFSSRYCRVMVYLLGRCGLDSTGYDLDL